MAELVCVLVSLHVLISQSFHCIIWFSRSSWVAMCKHTLVQESKYIDTVHMLPSNYLCKIATEVVGW